TARAESATISLLFASTAAETGSWEATAKAEMPAPNLRTVRRSRSQSVETASGFFMVSPEAADIRQKFSRSRRQVAKKSDPRLRFLSTARYWRDGSGANDAVDGAHSGGIEVPFRILMVERFEHEDLS